MLLNLEEDLDDTQRHQLSVFWVSAQFTSKEREKGREGGGRREISLRLSVSARVVEVRTARSAVNTRVSVTLAVQTHFRPPPQSSS